MKKINSHIWTQNKHTHIIKRNVNDTLSNGPRSWRSIDVNLWVGHIPVHQRHGVEVNQQVRSHLHTVDVAISLVPFQVRLRTFPEGKTPEERQPDGSRGQATISIKKYHHQRRHCHQESRDCIIRNIHFSILFSCWKYQSICQTICKRFPCLENNFLDFFLKSVL